MKRLVPFIIYGCLNSLLYVSLLPLWEGFDEPFHYGYVQQLSEHRTLPRFQKSHLSQEICHSLQIAPQSHVVKQNLPWVTTFDIHFQMMPEERTRRRLELNTFVSDGLDGTCAANYEAHQAPLAYALLAPVDALLKHSRLPSPVWYLRIICAVLSSLSTVGALYLLVNRLLLPAVVGHTAVFVVLSSQMFYATTAHIANDWLAVPLMVFLFERVIAAWKSPSYTTIMSLGATLGLGLLTKSYFIALVPYTFGVLVILSLQRRVSLRALLTFCVVLLALAGPWYTRNVLLYHNVTGMQETMGGAPLFALTVSGVQLPWIRSGRELLLGALWTGNNSLSTFSYSTLMLVLAGYCAAGTFCAYRISRGRLGTSERLLLCGCMTYGVALAYSAVVTFWYSDGKAISPSPWYVQPIIPVISTVLFGGLTRNRLHRVTAIWIVMLSAYVLGATYWVKLIPLYSGFPYGKATPGRLISWYADLGLVADRLSVTAMKGPVVILALAAAVVFLASAPALRLSWRWIGVVAATAQPNRAESADEAAVKITGAKRLEG
ncbi:MAG: glycosyltransferase family 39 protein [Acidobacteria bacterium]|nr:glycosyltransferase family 39 protein [Acidobacteriota bacterium]